MILFVNGNRGILFLSGIKAIREILIKVTTIIRQKVLITPTWKQ